ncbi:ATP-binding protein [Streptomyces nodosus]|uniref:histidine kinase n=1 Tax=Streptomyces nodosus TaxID=40318 RepID=A0A0B5DJ17_9ACTN|nr:ATP-binding protein [Streptomyces nodosus]AJE41205.1 histidine kinase [Streptomyces nodosus]MBB4792360.1 signal transduction histidine kinase [Streptomyces nodosus]QEV39752.1 sensor histidine kinase [Streptomyces nodosus]
MTALTPSGVRANLRAVAPAALGTAAVAGLAVVAAVLAAPTTVRVPLAWGGGAAALSLCVTVALAVHGTRSASLARRRIDTLAQDASRLLQERARLAEEFGIERKQLTDGLVEERVRLAEEFAHERKRLIKEFARERARLTDEFARQRAELTEESDRRRDRLASDVAKLTADRLRLVQRVRKTANARDAALAMTANVAGRMQALATGMLADLRAMEERHADEDVLSDLLHLDHHTAQAGRLADSVAVLAGARSGRRWARPIVMESILRGAMGRISGYQRIRVHSSSEAAVAGHAAEGVMHALAELLDNAANFSPPTAEVHVYVEEVPAGVIVSVEDAGLVMGEVQLRRAERAVSGDAELSMLTGTRLGLTVVGRLARKHGLRVSFRPSARGGTSALLLIPHAVLTRPTPPPATEPAPAPAARTAPGRRPSYSAARAVEDLGPGPVPAHGSPRTDSPAHRPSAHTSTHKPVHDSVHDSARTSERTSVRTSADDVPAKDGPGTGGLPRRRRGRALAEAEQVRDRAAARSAREPRTPDEAKVRAPRFGSFREAVRGARPDPTAPQDTTAETEPPQRTAPATPEGAHPPEAPEPHAPETAAADPVPEPTAPESAATPSHPEGDTTS